MYTRIPKEALGATRRPLDVTARPPFELDTRGLAWRKGSTGTRWPGPPKPVRERPSDVYSSMPPGGRRLVPAAPRPDSRARRRVFHVDLGVDDAAS